MYEFKRVPELLWVGVVAAGVFILQVALDFDMDTVENWETWLKALSSGAVRAFAGAVLARRR